jgi:hypothetical protein
VAGCALALVVLALQGCQDRPLAERLVCAYDEAAVAAYAADDFAGLSKVAGEAEQDKVRARVARKSRAGVRLEARLDRVEVTAVSRPGPDELIVDATERWRYHDRPVRPGLSPSPEIEAVVRLTYDFIRRDGGWRVQQVRAASTDYQGHRPASAHLGEPVAR